MRSLVEKITWSIASYHSLSSCSSFELLCPYSYRPGPCYSAFQRYNTVYNQQQQRGKLVRSSTHNNHMWLLRASYGFLVNIAWCHQMETFSALLALCEQNPPVTHKGQWRGALTFSLICIWTNGCANNRDAGDFRCHRAHYDVTITSR